VDHYDGGMNKSEGGVRRRGVAASSLFVLLVQHVVIEWDKETRGGGSAEDRARAPRVFDVPLLARAPQGTRSVLHGVSLGAHRSYDAGDGGTLQPLAMDSLAVGRVGVHREGGSVRVTLGRHHAEISPFAEGEELFVLAPGIWGQVRYTWKWLDREMYKSFEEGVVNVALTTLPPPRQPFVGEPLAARDARVDLW
jgi:hypothetical protein